MSSLWLIRAKPFRSKDSRPACSLALRMRTVLGMRLKVEVSWSWVCSTAPSLAGSVKRMTACTEEQASPARVSVMVIDVGLRRMESH